MTDEIVAKGYPWVAPSMLCNNFPGLSESRTTSLSQVWYQLMLNCVPLGHSCWAVQSMAVRHRWGLPVLHYHKIMVIYPYPFLW